jgi:hypothetical protein
MAIEQTVRCAWTSTDVDVLREAISRAIDFPAEVMYGIHLFIPNHSPADLYATFMIDELEGIEGEKAHQWISRQKNILGKTTLTHKELCKKTCKGEYSLLSNHKDLLKGGLAIVETMIRKPGPPKRKRK